MIGPRPVLQAARRIAVSAMIWYLALVLLGVGALAAGVALEFGVGYGSMTLGALALGGAELVRRGVARA